MERKIRIRPIPRAIFVPVYRSVLTLFLFEPFLFPFFPSVPLCLFGRLDADVPLRLKSNASPVHPQLPVPSRPYLYLFLRTPHEPRRPPLSHPLPLDLSYRTAHGQTT